LVHYLVTIIVVTQHFAVLSCLSISTFKKVLDILNYHDTPTPLLKHQYDTTSGSNEDNNFN